MQDKLAAIEAKYSQIEARLSASETYEDPALVAKLNKEQKELIRKLDKTMKEKNYTKRVSFFERLKDLGK